MNEKQEEYILSRIAMAMAQSFGTDRYYNVLGLMKKEFKELGDMND